MISIGLVTLLLATLENRQAVRVLAVECLGGMCALHLMLLHEIAHALDEVHEAEGEGKAASPPPLNSRTDGSKGAALGGVRA